MADDGTYVVMLAAALAQANAGELVAAQNGDNQLGKQSTVHPGLRSWNRQYLRIGHLDQEAFVLELNALLPDPWYVDAASHEHVHREHLTPPPGYEDDPTTLNWVYCAADAPGAIPITVSVPQTRDDEEATR